MLPRKKRPLERAEFLADVLATAVTGTVQRWAYISDFRWYDPMTGDMSPDGVLFNVGEPNAYVTVHEFPSELEAGRSRTVGVDDIADAMKQIACEEIQPPLPYSIVHTVRVNNVKNGHVEDLPVPDIDAGLADIIMQVAVLGEVVYG